MKLTNEEKRIKIAEACGWVWQEHRKTWWNEDQGLGRDDLPDYFGSLDAMHEAEKIAYKNQTPGWAIDYTEALQEQGFKSRDAIEYNWSWHATAAQRAEALGQTLNLWEAGQ